MSRTLDITTPENVAIRFELAGFGSRGVAASIDSVILLAIYTILFILVWFIFYLLIQAGLISSDSDMVDSLRMGASVMIGITIIVMFSVFWAYYVIFETLWQGQTPGKRMMRLRVIKDGGYPVDFRAVVIRNLMRIIDCMPSVIIIPSYAIAFVSIMTNPAYKRLGDLAAGTMVVTYEEEDLMPAMTGLGRAIVFRLLDQSVLTQLSRLNKDQFRVISQFLARRTELPPALRATFSERLATPLMAQLGYNSPSPGIDYERWLEELDLAYRNRALGASAQAAPTITAQSPVAKADNAPVEAPTPSDMRKW